MSDMDPSQLIRSSPPAGSKIDPVAGKAALSEATRHVDIIHTSLVGMTAIVLVLLVAVALPVFGYPPVAQAQAFYIMTAASMAGIGYLYYMNYKVHKHVSDQARLTEVLVNSLGQGFFSFDAQGACGPVYSQACLDLLETIPAGKNIKEVLHIPEAELSDFKDWMDILFMPNHALGFDDVVKFLPQTYTHSQGRRIILIYKPIRAKDGVLSQVVVIATDQTEEFEAQERAQQQQSYAEMICRIFKERNQFLATVTHIRKFVESAAQPIKREDSAAILRLLHTLKAAVKHYHLDELGDTIHRIETTLRSETITSDQMFQEHLRQAGKDIEAGLTAVMEQVRDLIGQDYEGRGNMHEVEESVVYEFAREMEARRADPALIRHFLSKIAAVHANDCFHQFDRELHDLAEITGKQVKPVRFTGSNPRILTLPIQEMLFSLTHICRNIVDHGIESPVARMAKGKDPAGQVSIHTDIALDDTHREWLHIIISDDGNGIDPSRIRAKLATIDPHGSWRHEDDQAIIQHIFSWGFSTRENVTDLSGHGVGMEAVDREVRQLGGVIKVYSELYRGTRFDIRVPYILDLHGKQDTSPKVVSI
ncbi:MAG: ATP-binding protein [Alphaproteobacteria bacterium]